MDKISLPQMEFMACHGVYPEEKVNPQLFRIGVEMDTDITKAGESDDLADTVNYAALYLSIKNLVENHTFALIEKLATEIAQMILGEEKVAAVTVTVEKAGAQVTAEVAIPARVSITRRREQEREA